MEKLELLSGKELININGGAVGPVDKPMKHKWYTVEGWVEFNYRMGYVLGKVWTKAWEAL